VALDTPQRAWFRGMDRYSAAGVDQGFGIGRRDFVEALTSTILDPSRQVTTDLVPVLRAPALPVGKGCDSFVKAK